MSSTIHLDAVELRLGPGKKAVTSELVSGRESHTTFKNNPEALNCLLWNLEAKVWFFGNKGSWEGKYSFLFYFLDITEL